MANTFLTPSIIAREALMRLQANLVMGGLVHRNYSQEYQKVGDTVTIRKPINFTAKDFVQGTGIEVQNATETSTSVTLDKWKDVSFELTTLERALKLEEISQKLIDPAMRAIAQVMDEDLLKLYVDVPHFNGTCGTTPSGISAFTGSLEGLDTRKVPMGDRQIVFGPVANAKLLELDSINSAEKSGTTEALRNASMGRIMGMDTYMDQNVQSHSIGTVSPGAGTGWAVSGSTATGSTTALIDTTTGSGTIKKGTLFTVAGDTTKYVLTADATVASNQLSIAFHPAVVTAWADNAVVTIYANHVANLAFHPNAFALVTRPLEPPMGGARGEVIAYNGIAVRVVYDYNITYKKDIVSLDVLYGVKTLEDDMAQRIVG